MGKEYKPTSYNSVSPYIIVPGVQKMIDFLGEVFDAQELRRFENTDGSIMHAEVRIDDSVIMMGGASEQWPANHSLIHVYVVDVDSVIEKAVRAGATLTQEPKQKEGDGDRRGSVEDFAGNTWSIGTQV